MAADKRAVEPMAVSKLRPLMSDVSLKAAVD
jgi:hypothetical protein